MATNIVHTTVASASKSTDQPAPRERWHSIPFNHADGAMVYSIPGGAEIARLPKEAMGHARLIAAAPELVEALRNLLSDATAADMANSEWSGSLIEARTLLARVEAK